MNVVVRHRRCLRGVLALAFGVLLTSGGCLGEPGIEDRWTLVDIESASVRDYQLLPAGSAQTFSVSTEITYRSIVTGFAVAELRASTLQPNQVRVGTDAAREAMAYDVDRILANSVTCGRATRAITGWDHLIQRIDFTFSGVVPAGPDTSGNTPGLFLVTFLGEGEEIELPGNRDSLVVTPFPSGAYEILPMAIPLAIGAP